jgi:hypothetical protein
MNIAMRHLLLTALAFVAFCGQIQAQIDPEKREARLAAFRAEVFTRVLNLTPDEAQAFWPYYNEYSDKREQIQQELKPAKQLDQMSDAEVEEQIKRHFDMKQRELELERDFYQKVRKVLPLRKIAKLPAAEREFRESLIKKLQEAREKRQERPLRPGRGRR